MFTGIVEERGSVQTGGARLAVACEKVTGDAEVGHSIAVNGVCLTVVDRTAASLTFDLSGETLARTSLGGLAPGDPVNLERPLTLAARLGGHLVQGHVDAVGEIVSLEPDGGGVTMRVRVPEGLRRYLVEKGSVAVDGVSLTVAALESDGFAAALVPHTLEVTTLGARRPGDPVNLEMDVLARYVEQMTRRDA